MKRRFAAALIIILAATTAPAKQIGQWTAYLSYRNITDIEPAGKTVFVLSSEDLFSYNTADNSITEYNKGNSLSDTGIKHIAWNADCRRLVIVYANGNIDLLDTNMNSANLPAYYKKNMMEDKTVNNITMSGNNAYLSTNFGILKINVKDEYISETYNLGMAISSTAIVGEYIYASSTKSNIMLRAKLKDNLVDKANWQQFYTKATEDIFNRGGRLIGVTPTEIIEFNVENGEMAATTLKNCADNNIKSCNINGGQLALCAENEAYLIADNANITTLSTEGTTILAYDNTKQCYWGNQQQYMLQTLTLNDNNSLTGNEESISANGPAYNYFFFLTVNNNKLYSTGGGFMGYDWLSSSVNREPCVQVLDENEDWTLFEDDMKKVTKLEYTDPSALAVDPRDPAHVMVASAKTGVYEFQDGKFVKLWNNKNSMLQTSIAYNSNYVVCCGITYDNEGNLWMTNGYLTSTPNKRILVEYTKDGEWVDHSDSFAEIGTAEYPLLRNLKSAFFDSRGLLWFVNDHFSCPALFCYNKQTNKLTAWKTFINQDGAEFSIGDGVHCVTEDKEGNIWVGTSLGTVMLTADEIMRGGSTFTQVKVPRNDGSNLADYLLSGTDISGIYVDDANRKWFATYKQGVYVISDDNIEEVYHFTTKNSELVSDVVESIAMNKETGEIFFGTDHGLCSYMTDAMKSYDEMESDNVYAFPNPVRPDYTGLITITGLTMNADIKIVTSSGQLVAQGRSTGGAFTWDGCDLDGKRVATGVYMVMTATSEGKKGVVCKIAVVN